MQLDDITVTVRDKGLARHGIIVPAELDLVANIDHNNVGTWKLSLRTDHDLAAILRTPGSGIIVDGPTDVLFSGPMVTPTDAISSSDPGGTLTIDGVTDTVILADALAYPDPARPANNQTLASDKRSGFAETLMHAYVASNIGYAATSARRKAGLINGTNLGRGAYVTKAPVFQPLGELLAELATQEDLDLGFRVVQRGAYLVFETYQVSDKSAIIRLDARNGTLASQKVATSPPGLTVAIVGGQGVKQDRQLSEYTSPASLAAQAEWGRRIERFIDQRSEDDPAELVAAGKEALDKDGYSVVSAQAVPADDNFVTFGKEWNLGDRVSVTVQDQELKVDVTGYVLKANSDGFRVGVVIGDPSTFASNLPARVSGVESRISAIERTTGVDQVRPYLQRGVVATRGANSGIIPSGAWTIVRFLTNRDTSTDAQGQPFVDHDTTIVTGGNFTFAVGGRYQINVKVTFPHVVGGSSAHRAIQIISPTRGVLGHFSAPATSTSFVTVPISDSMRFTAGETFYVQVFNAESSPQTLVAGDGYQSISVEYLGR